MLQKNTCGVHLVIFRNFPDILTPFNCLRPLNGVFAFSPLFTCLKLKLSSRYHSFFQKISEIKK